MKNFIFYVNFNSELYLWPIFEVVQIIFFVCQTGLFCGEGEVQKLFWGLVIYTNNFCFLSMAQFGLYRTVLFFLRTEGQKTYI